MSRDIPIIFSAPMVLAFLREIEKPGTGKTMTRRLAWHPYKKLPKILHPMARLILGIMHAPTAWQTVKPGDRLWVRENWRTLGDGPLSETTDTTDFNYQSTATEAQLAMFKWRPSIHMPRWASRITLEVTATKIEPLQSISEADAIAEGIEPVDRAGYPRAWKSYETYPNGTPHPHAIAPNLAPTTSFRELWNSLHGPEAWAANPEVVAISVKPHLCNIDQMKEAA